MDKRHFRELILQMDPAAWWQWIVGGGRVQSGGWDHISRAWIRATLSSWDQDKGNRAISFSWYPHRMSRTPKSAQWMTTCLKCIQCDARCVRVYLCVFQLTRTACQIWSSPWRASGWWAPATTRAWAGCAPRAAACWGDTTSTPGPPACSILSLFFIRRRRTCVCFHPWLAPPPLRYDHETQHAFVGDYSGQITLLKLEKQTYSTITTLKGHQGKRPGQRGANRSRPIFWRLMCHLARHLIGLLAHQTWDGRRVAGLKPCRCQTSGEKKIWCSK